MVKVHGRTILERMISTFNKCGIYDIIVITGYKKELITYPSVRYYYNPDYRTTNNLASLFCAENEMDDEFITSFSDILFEEGILRKLLTNEGDITLVIDEDWMPKYKNRTLHPTSEADKVVIVGDKVTRIGKTVELEKTEGEFIGLAKFSVKGAGILKRYYHQAKSAYSNRPFYEATVFEKAHLMDIFQYIIDNGGVIRPTLISEGWAEIDTPEDFENVIRIMKEV